MCGQSKLIVHVGWCVSITFMDWGGLIFYLPQIAGLQLLEQGKITLETPVSDYLPEFSNLVIVENQMVDVLTYKPAKTIMRYKHLLDYTGGLYYPSKEVRPDRLNEAYIASHDLDDPISRFISIIKVRIVVKLFRLYMLSYLMPRETYLVFLFYSNLGRIVGYRGALILLTSLMTVVATPGSNGWGSDIIGFIIEKITGQSLEKYLYVALRNRAGRLLSDEPLNDQTGESIQTTRNDGLVLSYSRYQRETCESHISTRWSIRTMERSIEDHRAGSV